MAWHQVNGRILDAQIATSLGARMTLILIVEDHAAFRGAPTFLLERDQDMEVTAVVGSLAGARDALGGVYDVAVIELPLPDEDGIGLIGELQQSSPGVCVLVLSATVERGRSDEVREAGVDAMVDKVASPLRMVGEVRRLAAR